MPPTVYPVLYSSDVRHAHMPDDTSAHRILVVEYEPAVRMLGERMLKKWATP